MLLVLLTELLAAQSRRPKEVLFAVRGTVDLSGVIRLTTADSSAFASLSTVHLEEMNHLILLNEFRIEAVTIHPTTGRRQSVGKVTLAGLDPYAGPMPCRFTYQIKDLPPQVPIVVYVTVPAALQTDPFLSPEYRHFRARGWSGIVTLTKAQPVCENGDFVLQTLAYEP